MAKDEFRNLGFHDGEAASGGVERSRMENEALKKEHAEEKKS